ncbi:hypothetical protein OS145_10505 [Idiomarina baltica OS145]|uniref:Uncharacterized protein n=1 Tax=Idiomarina baltica OS145 TaxID=314276 RepID=A0ABM9WL66_9GAMM|nr:hypothetical protein OS145_10505 [Idiomarina baltica OS145]
MIDKLPRKERGVNTQNALLVLCWLTFFWKRVHNELTQIIICFL